MRTLYVMLYTRLEINNKLYFNKIGVLCVPMYLTRSRDSSVGIATGYGLDDQGEREFESR
jgi:hypothetical protein